MFLNESLLITTARPEQLFLVANWNSSFVFCFTTGEGGVDGDGHLSGTKSCNGQPPHYPSANDGADATSSASVRNECRALGGGGGGHKSLNESLGNVGSSTSSSTSSTSSSSGDERSSRAAVPLLWQPMNKQQPLAMMEETSNSSRSSAASPFPPPLLPPPPFSSSSTSSSTSTSCQRSGAIPTAFVSPAVSTSESVAAGSRSASDATATPSYSSSTFQVESEQEPTNRWPSATNNSAAVVSHPPTASPVNSSGTGREVLVRQVSRFSVMQTSLDGDQQQLSSSAAAGTAGDSLANPPPSGELRDPCSSSSSATIGVHRPLTSSSSNQSRRQRGRSGRTREGGGGGGGHSRARRQRSNMSAASGTSRASTVSSPDTPIVRSQRRSVIIVISCVFLSFVAFHRTCLRLK